ncbi:MAG: hypothetical protein E4G95_08275, partial [Bacteroidia bacterium]
IDRKANIWLTATDTTGKSLLISFKDGIYQVYNDIDPVFKDLNVRQIIYDKLTGNNYLIIGNNFYIWEKRGLTKMSDLEISGMFRSKDEIIVYSGLDFYYISDNKLVRRSPEFGTETWISPFWVIHNEEGSVTVTDFKKKLYIDWPFGHPNGFFQDSDSATWVASEDGLIKLLSGSIKNFTRADGIEPNTWSVVEDINGDIIFSSVNGILIKYDYKGFEKINGFSTLSNLAFTVGSKKLSDGRCWFTTYNGIIEWDGNIFRKLNFPKNQVECIYEDVADSIILIGATEGMYMINHGDTTLFSDVVPGKLGYIRDICKDSEGIYWIVTNSSVYRFDGAEFKGFSDENHPIRNGLTCGTDSSGTLWFGGEDGLFWFDRDTEIFRSAIPEVENHAVRFIKVMDNNRLMVGRVGDFIILDTEKRERGDSYFYSTFDRSNGFMGGGCIQNGVMIDSHGKYWILSAETVTVFDPEDNMINNNPPVVYISSLDVLDDHLNWNRKYDINVYEKEPAQKLVLRYNENNIRFSVIGLSTHRPERVLFRYRLSGNDSDWSQATPGKLIVLPGLNHGRYTFEVEACSAEGIWSVKPARVELSIRPAFWQTVPFIILSVSAAVIILVLIASYSIRKRIETRQMRIRTVREYYRIQMGNFVQQFDPHFTFNVLASVAEFIDSGRNEIASEYLMRFSHLLRTVVTEERYTRSLENELDFIKDYFEMQKLKMGNRLTYNIKADNPEALKVTVPRMVIHNFVENAIKWGIGPKTEGGEINIAVTGSEPITVSITDTGIGREAASKK